MNINLCSFSGYTVSFLSESVLPSISAQQKKILVIASIAFAILAALYAASHCCFEEEILNGPGKKTNPNGSVSEGEFKDGKLHGQGKMTFKNGEVWEGEFKQGKLKQGKEIYPGGTVIEGEFKDRKLHGQGKITRHDGRVTEGEFRDGSLRQGKITDYDGNIFEGEFKNGLLHGKGKMTTFKNEEVREGEFNRGQLNGQGKITYLNFEVVEGEFKAGVLNGQGKKTYDDGSVDEGECKNGVLHGKGKRTHSDGKIEEGFFRQGHLYELKIDSKEKETKSKTDDTVDQDQKNDPLDPIIQSPIKPLLNSDVLPADTTPVTPVQPPEDPKQKKLSAILDNIRHELNENELNADKLKALIEEYSKLSIFKPAEYLTIYEEILKTLAARLHDAINTKTAWRQLMPVVVEVIWTMHSYNPMQDVQYQDIFDRVIKLKTQLLDIDIKMKRLMAEHDSAEQCYKISFQGANVLISAPGVSDEMKQRLTDGLQKEKTKRDQKMKELEEKVEIMRKQLKDLSELLP